ncbi:Spx/MgsR family RNA polymerase-binding regulatory protein [Salinispirillum marinum]|uniref:Spx/MgsR family RNA polymerase-binding regulatory protein n=2 Tax=Saccharospirillaceae TaxID=255527 RepID=A0ABV8BIA3_9GAMM
MIKVYGIKQCDTMKKAFTWLNEKNIPYDFHDYKKADLAPATFVNWLNQADTGVLINRRGTTWRKLSADQQAACDSGDAEQIAAVAVANSSVIKRPVVETENGLLVGFNAAQWTEHFA